MAAQDCLETSATRTLENNHKSRVPNFDFRQPQETISDITALLATMYRPLILIIAIASLAGCVRNIYQIPDSVQPLAQKAVKTISVEPGLPYVMIEGKNPAYQLMFSSCPKSSKKLLRLIRHSGLWVEIGGKCFHLITAADRDLSKLTLARGESHTFSGRWSFFDGPWVSWTEAQVTDSWLSPRWQSKHDSLSPKQSP